MADPGNGINESLAQYIEAMSMTSDETLKSIDLTLKAIARNDGIIISQSSLRDLAEQERMIETREMRNPYNRRSYNNTANAGDARNNMNINRPDRNASGRSSSNSARRNNFSRNPFDDLDTYINRRSRQTRSFFDQLTDSFEDEFKKAILGSANPISDGLREPIRQLAEKLGVDVDNIGTEIGKRLGQVGSEAFKRSGLGGRLTQEWRSMSDFLVDSSSRFIDSVGDILADPNLVDNFNIRDILDAGRDSIHDGFEDVFGNANDVVNDLENAFDFADNGPLSRFNLSDLATRGANALRNMFNLDEDGGILQNRQNGPGGNRQRRNASSDEQSNEDIIETIVNIHDLADGTSEILDATIESGSGLSDVIGSLSGEAGGFGGVITQITEGAGSLIPQLGGMAEGAGALAGVFPWATAAIVAGIVAIDLALDVATFAIKKFAEQFEPAINGFKQFFGALKSAGNSVKTANANNLELYKQRIEADVTAMAKAPFDILEQAANKALDTWDAVLRTVTATQGYEKAGLQSLWASYAQRLQNEKINGNNLSSVISSADIMSNLESVLKQGLSGTVAEEFAYIATKLNAAIPTQDFFQYAETYASLVANSIKNGATQEQALKRANSQLEDFASNVLYASREISGGLSTSLTNAASLFEQSAKIAITGRAKEESSIAKISGVLTSVSATVGSIAPDLAQSIVDAVVQAATGGNNSSNLTALRSMAGTGASNTAFLKALTSDPKKVFSTLFENLSQLQNMSADNYMEVAEGLSSIFGISMDAFARVDFDYLAKAIDSMNINSNQLDENMKLLVDGQTTSNADQMRIQKINEYMINEGLAYVLDNEVARAVQQHMWEEQLAREIKQNTFAVELAGSTLTLFQGIKETVSNIFGILNPKNWFRNVGNAALTALEAASLSKDVAQVVEMGKVGSGNKVDYAKLLVGNKNLDLTDKYVELLGGYSHEAAVESAQHIYQNWTDQQNVDTGNIERIYTVSGLLDTIGVGLDQITKDIDHVGKTAYNAINYTPARKSTRYNWNVVSKGLAEASSGDWRAQGVYNPIIDKDLQTVINNTQRETLRKLVEGTKAPGSNEASDLSMASFINKSTSSASDKVDAEILKEFTTARAGYNKTELEETRGYLTQAELENLVNTKSASMSDVNASASFNDWIKYASKEMGFDSRSGATSLEASLSEYGLSLVDLEKQFNETQAAQSSRSEHARQLHEIQFWEDSQDFMDKYFRKDFHETFLRDTFYQKFLYDEYYKSFMEGKVYKLLTDWFHEWTEYYIAHTAYSRDTNDAYTALQLMKEQESHEQSDAVYALANALASTDNLKSLKDPVVQTNVLLAQILLVAEAIMQQNNESSVVSVPTALSSLALGLASPSSST